MSAASHIQPEAPWAAGLRGARANLVPGLILQAFALTLVLAYYYHAPTRERVYVCYTNINSAWAKSLKAIEAQKVAAKASASAGKTATKKPGK